MGLAAKDAKGAKALRIMQIENFPGLFSGTSRLQLCKIGFDEPSPAYIVFTSADLLCIVVDD